MVKAVYYTLKVMVSWLQKWLIHGLIKKLISIDHTEVNEKLEGNGVGKNMVKFVEKHKIVPIVDTVFPLRDGNAAMKRMDEGAQFGKLVLSI